MADRNVNILLTATDLTGKAVASASASLKSLASTAIGTAAGFGLYSGVQAIFGGITDTVFGMNNSLDATKRQAVTMLDSIRNSSAQTGETIKATAKQTADWGRQLRDIREREADGFADFARRTKDLNDELTDLLVGKNLQKRARDENEALNDLAEDHADRVAELQADLEKEQRKGIYVDGILYQQGNQERIAELQSRIDKENHEYDKTLERRKREYDEDLAEMQEANNKRIAELRESLEEQKQEELKFTREIKEAYGDLETAKRMALTAGSGAAGTKEAARAIITYRDELKKLGKTGAEIFGQFEQFFKEEGVRSPFNVADIQAAGAQLAQFSGGNLDTMRQIVRMAESLASSPAVQQFSASERLNLGIRALAEAYNGQFVSLQRIFNIAGPTFDQLQEGTFTTTEFTKGLNGALEASGINYSLVDQQARTFDGALGNLVETGKLLLANITSPIYAAFTGELIRMNDWATRNQGAINAWAETLKNQLAGFIQTEVLPRLHDLEKWFGQYLSSGQWRKDLDGLVKSFEAIGKAVMGVVDAINGMKKAWDGISGVTGKVVSAPKNALDWLSEQLFPNLFGKRASGGPVVAGSPYLVGERGPELIVPGQSGTVIPADQTRQLLSQGGPMVHIEHFHAADNVDMDAFARNLAWMIS